MDHRLKQLKSWLSQDLNYIFNSIEPASTDASFRRYFRVRTDDGELILMDAPPGKESTKAFIDVALALADLGVHTPAIHAQNREEGFILLEDLGQRTYLNELSENAESLYGAALDALIKIQGGVSSSEFEPPIYHHAKLLEEMSLFSEWFVGKHLGRSINASSLAVWLHTQQTLAQACVEQPQVWVHRDYHSRNLVVTDTDSPGVIDFQDLVVGPIGYDLASLFKDCYIEWPRARQREWLQHYRRKARAQLTLPDFSLEQLVRWVDFAGLQRHLKVLGIFCRLNYRDGKDQYLDDLPLVTRYILEVLNIYPEFETFKRHFEAHLRSTL